MTTEKYMMLKNIINKHIGEEGKMLGKKMRNCIERDEDLPKNIKKMMLDTFNFLIDGDEKIEEKIMNIQFDENDVNFFKEMVKKIKEDVTYLPIFDKIDDDFYNCLLDMKN